MSRSKKSKNPHLDQHPATIFTFSVQPFSNPSTDYMLEHEWRDNLEDVPSDFFGHHFKLHNSFDIPFETDGTEKGFFYYSNANNCPFYFLPAFFEKYKAGKFYCLALSFINLADLLDAKAYPNEIEYTKAVKNIVYHRVRPEQEGYVFIMFKF